MNSVKLFKEWQTNIYHHGLSQYVFSLMSIKLNFIKFSKETHKSMELVITVLEEKIFFGIFRRTEQFNIQYQYFRFAER